MYFMYTYIRRSEYIEIIGTLYLFTMESQIKRIQTVNERYNVDNVAQLPQVQTKRRATFESKRTTIMFYQEPRTKLIQGSDLLVYKLDKAVSDNWLNTYHPFRAPRGTMLSLGLVKDNTIYCLMTFKKSRDSRYTAELSRMWMLPTFDVIEGYDVLSSEASKFGIDSIVSYVNMSFENYLDYESIGMKYIRDIQRTKWWVNNDIRISDASRRQYKITPESLLAEGYLPVYDCGQRVYVFE